MPQEYFSFDDSQIESWVVVDSNGNEVSEPLDYDAANEDAAMRAIESGSEFEVVPGPSRFTQQQYQEIAKKLVRGEG